MAEDTRLAEASLLLNYSNQSYREQMLLTKKLQENGEASGVSSFERNQLVKKESSSSKLITPPPEHEDTVQETSVFGFDKNCINEINLATDGSQESTTSYPRAVASGSGHHSCNMDQHYDSNAEPIKNLLAAINCALPEFKNRPTILQRPSSSKTAATCSHRLLSDHDYCLKEPYSSAQYVVNNVEQTSDVNRNHRKSVPNDRTIALKSKQEHSNSVPDLHRITHRRRLKLVAVHLGAGTSSNETDSLRLAKTICEEVMLQTAKEDDQFILNNSRKRRKNPNNTCSENQTRFSDNIHNHQYHYSDLNDHSDSAENAVVQLIKRMEDIQTLNCGYGSNLNIMGQVECDASLMCDRTQTWTGVGAVSGCKNPILLAKSLYDYQHMPRALGLIQPNLLVGSGAKQWMREHCPHLSIMDSKLISSKSFSTYQRLKSRYDTANRTMQCSKPPQQLQHLKDLSIRHKTQTSINTSCNESNRQSNNDKEHAQSPTTLDHGFYCAFTRENLKRAQSHSVRNGLRDNRFAESSDLTNGHNIDGIELQQPNQNRLDTVGAIAVDCDNNFASAISSGGLLLKYKGRVGQAAVPGAGCWCENSIAVTTTGVGEYLTLNLFARKFYDKMLTLRMLFDLGHVEREADLSNLISYTMDECFEDLLQSSALAHVASHERLAGMLSVSSLNSKSTESPKRIDDNELYLSFAHNTHAMCVGYMTSNDHHGHSIMSRGKSSDQDGRPVVETIKFSIDPNTECTSSIGGQSSDNEISTS